MKKSKLKKRIRRLEDTLGGMSETVQDLRRLAESYAVAEHSLGERVRVLEIADMERRGVKPICDEVFDVTRLGSGGVREHLRHVVWPKYPGTVLPEPQ